MKPWFALFVLFAVCPPVAAAEPPLRIAIAGLVHGHVDGFLRAMKGRTDVELVGIFDPDRDLQKKYAARYGYPQTILFADLTAMLDRAKPQAVAGFTSTYDHPALVEACAPRKIHVMMEKPLAVNMQHAARIQKAAAAGPIHVLVNYETTWYRSHGALYDLMKTKRAAGAIRKMIAMDGHEGPKEIGVGPEFLYWLTDPVKNGAGALFDFGCYGANLMTWLMDNQRPLSVSAVTQQVNPQVYPKVDDEANVLVEYPDAVGIIQGSWNWPFSRKDLEVYGETGYAIATGGNSLRVRLKGTPEETPSLEPLPSSDADAISYLVAVARGERAPAGLSSLENNLIVTEILEAALESARTGRVVRLTSNGGRKTP